MGLLSHKSPAKSSAHGRRLTLHKHDSPADHSLPKYYAISLTTCCCCRLLNNKAFNCRS